MPGTVSSLVVARAIRTRCLEQYRVWGKARGLAVYRRALARGTARLDAGETEAGQWATQVHLAAMYYASANNWPPAGQEPGPEVLAAYRTRLGLATGEDTET